MGSFVTSSHRKQWTFSSTAISELRQSAFDESNELILDLIRLGSDIDAVSGMQIDKALTLQEGLYFLSSEMKTMLSIAKQFKLPKEVCACALTFFQRFFLFRSVLDFNPELVGLACLYLASKSEEVVIAISDLCKFTKYASTSILSVEVAVLDALDFKLQVHHPFIPLKGLTHQAVGNGIISSKEMKSLLLRMEEIVEYLHLTDAILQFAPAHLALASFYQACDELKQGKVWEKLLHLHTISGTYSQRDQLMQRVHQVLLCIEHSKRAALSDSELNGLKDRWHLFHNPLFDPNSILFSSITEERIEEKDRKRSAKYRKRVREEIEDGLDNSGEDEEFIIHSNLKKAKQVAD